jgi:hypothetical protein
LQLVTRSSAFEGVVEWQPPVYDQLGQKFFLVQLFIAVVLLVRRPSYRAALPIAAFGLAALLSVRNIVPASLVIAPGMALAVGRGGSLDGRLRARLFTVATVAIVVVSVPLATLGLSGPAADVRPYPVDALAWLDARGQIDPDVRLMTPDFVANFIEARYGPDRARVFIDDRVDMFPLQVSRDYSVLLAGEPGWGRILDRYGAEVVLWPAERPLTSLMVASTGWRLVHRDDDWVVAVPQDSSLRSDG